MSYLELIEELIKDEHLKTSEIIEAFKAIDRADFLPDDLKNQAGINAPILIGHEQTISQPLTVAFMLELLQPKAGDKILDIGTGSGWQTALLAQIVGQKGKVFSIEFIPELAEFGKNNILKYSFIKKGIVKTKQGDGTIGWSEGAPFDKIIAAASGDRIPDAWREQLKVGGRIVAPVRESIWVLEKREDGSFKEEEYPGFMFVPLVQN